MMMAGALKTAFLYREDVQQIYELLNQRGGEGRIVGGAVRNALLGLPISDFDLATTLLPQEVMARARSAGIKAVPTGIDHGTVTLVLGGVPFEVTTLREDIDTDGRRAVVRFGTDFEKDALRRDFTINALSVSADGRLYDYAGGVADIATRQIRFIGDAETRIREDFLRILRFFRFSAVYGQGVEPEGLGACIRLRDGMRQLSRERIRQETLKMLVAPNAAAVVTVMSECGILGQVLGGVAQLLRFIRLVACEAENAVGPDVARRLMALGVLVVEDIHRLRDGMRLTNHEQTRLEITLKARDFMGWADEYACKILLYRLGSQAYTDAVLDAAALGRLQGQDLHNCLTLPARWAVPKFPLSGKDMLARGIPRGPEIARALQEEEARWIEMGMPAEWP